MTSTHDQDPLKAWIERLEATPAFADHPLMDEFRKLAQRHSRLERQLTKMARISDRYQAESRRLAEELERVSRTDSLTGLANRRALGDQLAREVNRANRVGTPMSLIMIDIDRFKRVNDTHGHEAGDRVLVAVAMALRGGLRDYDAVGRWGGEEFLALLPHTDEAGAVSVAEHLRRAVASLAVPCGDEVVRPTVSLGIARLGSDEAIGSCVNRADEALYQAKAAGRDRWMLAPPAQDSALTPSSATALPTAQAALAPTKH